MRTYIGYNFSDGNAEITNKCNGCQRDIHINVVECIDVHKYTCLSCGEVHTGQRYNDGDRDRIVFKKDYPSWLLTGERKYEEE